MKDSHLGTDVIYRERILSKLNFYTHFVLYEVHIAECTRGNTRRCIFFCVILGWIGTSDSMILPATFNKFSFYSAIQPLWTIKQPILHRFFFADFGSV